MAERVGFEPTLRFPVNTLSKRAPSATRPPLQTNSPEGARTFHQDARKARLCAFSHSATSPAPLAHGGGGGLLQAKIPTKPPRASGMAAHGKPAPGPSAPSAGAWVKTIRVACQAMIDFLYHSIRLFLFHFEQLSSMKGYTVSIHISGFRR